LNFGAPLQIWALGKSGKPFVESTAPREAIITAATFAPDSLTVATAEVRFGTEPLVRIRASETAKPLHEFRGAFLTTQQMAFSRDGAHLVARAAGSLACWILADRDRAPRKAVNPGRKHFVALAVHPDGPVLSVDNDRLVRVWTVPELTLDRTITWNVGKLYAVAVSPDGTRAAVGSHTGKVLVWDWD
jgi:WD40 repeat protein